MRIEVICTGDELLTGLTVDTNSPYFMERLFDLGEQVRRTTIVGDERVEIEDALRTVAARADLVLVSGGLGPTADDLTAECAAHVAGVPLVEDAPTLARIKARFAQRGVAFTPNNARQARVPEGAAVVASTVGSAPMFILTLGRATVFFVAGVPREYRHLVDTEVLPRIVKRMEREPGRTYRAHALLRTVNLPESHLDARIAPVARAHPQVRFGFRTQAPENHLKLLAEGKSQAEADRALDAAEHASRDVLGSHLFGTGEDFFAEVVGRELKARGQTVALAESCTGGRVADLLTAVPGSSAYFLGSAVCYANTMKERWLGVPAQMLERHGAVSERVALEMAEGARRAAGATWGLSVTGVAGPGGGTEHKPVGTVFIGLAGPKATQVKRLRLSGDRNLIRQSSAYALLDLLRVTLMQE